MEKVKIGEKEFLIKINRKRVQTMRLKIIEKNKIVINIPWLMPMIVVKKFIDDNKNWILKQNEKIKKKKNRLRLKLINKEGGEKLKIMLLMMK